ncbi:MAG: hypothetical protein H7329_04935 [Opitutaceae bacterium]|nr:hypothetical protein [Cytophagales bacterium]
MFPLLDLGEKQYPELYDAFVISPDKAVEPLPSLETLRATWKQQLGTMQAKFEEISAEEWFGRHTVVSEEEFLKEPHRNKLNILLTRSTHLTYHWGQLMLLK